MGVGTTSGRCVSLTAKHDGAVETHASRGLIGQGGPGGQGWSQVRGWVSLVPGPWEEKPPFIQRLLCTKSGGRQGTGAIFMTLFLAGSFLCFTEGNILREYRTSCDNIAWSHRARFKPRPLGRRSPWPPGKSLGGDDSQDWACLPHSLGLPGSSGCRVPGTLCHHACSALLLWSSPGLRSSYFQLSPPTHMVRIALPVSYAWGSTVLLTPDL